jgi:hypothetical protein
VDVLHGISVVTEGGELSDMNAARAVFQFEGFNFAVPARLGWLVLGDDGFPQAGV